MAAQPSTCGQLGCAGRSCACTPHQISGYRARISGPLLDRFDIHLEVLRIKADELGSRNGSESSAAVRQRVLKAREIQARRLAAFADLVEAQPAATCAKSGWLTEDSARVRSAARCNAEMSVPQIREHCALDAEGRRLLHAAVDRLGLSARAYHRILKVARTLADLADEQEIQVIHLAEAIQYRMLDRSIPTCGPHT